MEREEDDRQSASNRSRGSFALAKEYPGSLANFRVAAGAGIPFAQFMLGKLYLNGNGVRRDRGEAKRWFRRAANHGNQAAAQYLEAISATGTNREE